MVISINELIDDLLTIAIGLGTEHAASACDGQVILWGLSHDDRLSAIILISRDYATFCNFNIGLTVLCRFRHRYESVGHGRGERIFAILQYSFMLKNASPIVRSKYLVL